MSEESVPTTATPEGREHGPEAAASKTAPTDVNDLAKRVAAAFGEIVGVLMRAPQYRHVFLSELEWLVLPALATGQFALASARHKDSTLLVPVAVILWASVSNEIDARLGAFPDRQIKLKPDEWSSGSNAWLVEGAGEARAIKSLINQTLAGPLKGRGLKVIAPGEDGKPTVQTLRTADEAAPAAESRT